VSAFFTSLQEVSKVLTKSKKVSFSEFGKLVGISVQAVTQLVESGKITPYLLGGRRVLDPKEAKAQYEANVEKTVQAKSQKRKKTPQKVQYVAPAKFDEEGEMTTAEADRRAKVYKSKLSEIKYLEQAGKLIPLEKVQRQAYECGRKVRDAVMSVPARFAHELAVETEPLKLEIKLSKILAQVLEKSLEYKEPEIKKKKKAKKKKKKKKK
jgi:hypothetical protein